MNKFINNLASSFGLYLSHQLEDSYDKVDPGLVRFYKTEYGKDWRHALSYHLYKSNAKNDKKAA